MSLLRLLLKIGVRMASKKLFRTSRVVALLS